MQTKSRKSHIQHLLQNPLRSWSFWVWSWRLVWLVSAKLFDFSSVCISCLIMAFVEADCSFNALVRLKRSLVISSWVCCSLAITASKSRTGEALELLLLEPSSSVFLCLKMEIGLSNSLLFSFSSLVFGVTGLFFISSSLTWLVYWAATLCLISVEIVSPYGDEQGERNCEATTLSEAEDCK